MLSHGVQVTQSLIKFYVSFKDQNTDVARTTANLESLSSILQSLFSALEHRIFRTDEQDLIKEIGSSVRQCEDLIRELKEEFEKFDEDWVNGFKSRNKTAGRRVKYPFRQSTLQKLDENIKEIRSNISLALELMQVRDSKAIRDDITEVKSLIEVVRATQISREIRDWLKAPDATIDHQTACAKRYPGTGQWFVKGSIFTKWSTQDNSFLWLSGFAGCGKSVLCSTAIQYTFRQKLSNQNVGIAFFYFTFNDESKQDESAMLRALLLQLSNQWPDSQTELAQFHKLYGTGTPPPTVLIAHLQRLIQKFDEVYILLDALDESPRPHKRHGVLRTITEMRKWLLTGLHLLATSRDEHDIRKSLDPKKDTEVIMKNTEINQDISDFISGQLTTDSNLLEWKADHDCIRQVLSERAQGVFRWVECQLQSLKDCPQSEYYLDECLQSLPQTLDETYERILCSINKVYIEDTRRILTLLCFSSRPLTVQELGDGVAVDFREPVHLNLQRRLHNADDFRKLCPGLIDIDTKPNNDSDRGIEIQRNVQTLRIAHFSVQEYLESDRIKQQKASSFALESRLGHTQIARICLIYLLEPKLSSGPLNQTKLKEFPLAHYAALFWHHHYENADRTEPQLDRLILALFQEPQEIFFTWVKLHDPEMPWNTRVNLSLDSAHIAAPVYYASLLGLNRVVYELIEVCLHANQRRDLVNVQGGRYGNALQAASEEGHAKVVQMLMDAGADVNAQGGRYSNALQAASYRGHEKVVQMLMDAGADVNAQGREYGNALQAASEGGHEKVVQMLMDAGADVNAQGGRYDNALQAASEGGHEKVVQILMDAGAGVNAQGGEYGNALQAASEGGHANVVQMLMDAGADVNAQGGRYGNALQAALYRGHEKVVQMLIDEGADFNAQGGRYGNALQAALYRGHEKVVRMLMDAGADVNAQGGFYGNALQAASEGGHVKVVQMLMDAGADVNAQGGEYGNALQAASEGGHAKVVQMLMDAGADVNAQGGRYGNALQAASEGGHMKVVQMLMDAGVDVNAQGGEYGNALQAASEGGHAKVVQMLMDAGADVNAQGGEYGNALQAASEGGHKKVVQMLMDAGADVNAQGGRYGNALQAASEGGHVKVVQMLMDAGAEVNAQGGRYGNALQAASYRGHEKVVQMLMDTGGDTSAQGGEYGNALQAASEGGHVKVVQMLMDAGADVNAQGREYGNALQAASEGGHANVVQMLMDAGADVNAQGGRYGNALQAASEGGHKKVVQMLMDAGADVNAQADVNGEYGNALAGGSDFLKL
ncbi:hypothetical protein DV736_g628, partial [Chaetothyriales sp. CBS 134916]